MLTNSVAYVFVDDELMNDFKSSESDIHLIIGSKIERKAIARELLPISSDFIEILRNISKIDLDFEKYKNISDRKSSMIELGLSNEEAFKLNLLLSISKMIPQGLYLIGILVKTINDDNRPVFRPKVIKQVLNTFFDAKLTDFVNVLLTKYTFAKLISNSANFGEIDFKSRQGMNEKYGSVHFSLKVNFECNRVYYPHLSISEINDESMKYLARFNNDIKEVVENSFLVLNHKEISKTIKSTSILNEIFEDKNEEYQIKMLIPLDIMDKENIEGKQKKDNKMMLFKLKSNTVLHLFFEDSMIWKDVLSEIKLNLFKYINDNIEKLFLDKYLDFAHPIVFSLDIDNKAYIKYKKIDLVFDIEDSSSSIEEIFQIVPNHKLIPVPKTKNKFFNLINE